MVNTPSQTNNAELDSKYKWMGQTETSLGQILRWWWFLLRLAARDLAIAVFLPHTQGAVLHGQI